MQDLNQGIASTIVMGIGILLTSVHLVHGAGEVTAAPEAVLSGMVIPLFVSLLLVASGYWMVRQPWVDVSPWRVVGWVLGGFGVGLVLSLLLGIYQTAEGTVLSDQFYVYSIFATYGSAIGLLVGRYDVNSRVQYAKQRRKTQRLDTFAAVLSHDLRNPLNVAAGRLELVMAECENDHLSAIEHAHDRMEVLIENLLSFAREGEEVTETTQVSLGEISERCWRTVETWNASLEVETTSEVQADRSRLEQLFENLFRNAIEHGGESVTVTVGDLPNGRGFFVRDTGPGIPAAKRDDVFDAGYSTVGGGIGFGLSIVREIVDAHGWEIEVTAGPESGAQFNIYT